jgi:SAM-dependent methyltransferase
MVEQSIETKKAEIEFRRKLAEQHAGGPVYFEDEPDAEEITEIMAERMAGTRRLADELGAAGVSLSPYMEIGAERCQRALVLENEYGCHGVAADISLDSLLFAERIAEADGYREMPVRVCCDAERLPVRKGAARFAFCYQTLHHFLDPSPVVAELARVLAGDGAFYFDEEPVRMRARIMLFRRGNNPVDVIGRLLVKLRLADFFSDTGRAEVEAGVTETDFTVAEWARILQPFDYSGVKIDSRKLHSLHLTELLRDRSPKRWWVALMGGNVHGICRVRGNKSGSVVENPIDALVCPECLSDGIESGFELKDNKVVCRNCAAAYPSVKGVYLLFNKVIGCALYPGYFK